MKISQRVQKILANPEYADLWEPYPFNAGYFMCLRLKGIGAEEFRKHLLDKYGVGVIADGERDAGNAMHDRHARRELRAIDLQVG